jgi:hypothetical protein
VKRRALVLLYCVLLAPTTSADEWNHKHDSPSVGQLGVVHFPISCNASVQERFERGIALLHSFWYEEAERQFEQIGESDPQCAMAHWGVAMSLWHQLWDEPTPATIKRGGAELYKAQSLRPPTPREQGYVSALSSFYGEGEKTYRQRASAYSAAMEHLYQQFPGDHEAAAFYALSLLSADAHSLNAILLLEKLFDEKPRHPGVAHYLIHACDSPELAQRGLAAARRYANIAPESPHALHMPSHIFVRFGLWDEDIRSNIAAIAAAQKGIDKHIGGEFDQLHAMDFLVYAYLQSGREAEVQEVIEKVRNMPPRNDDYGPARLFVLSALPASYDLELHHWSEAASLDVVSNATPGMQAITYIARAIGAARSGNLESARNSLNQLQLIVRELATSDEDVSAAIEREMQIAVPWIEHLEGKDDDALRLLRSLADSETGVSEANQGIPPRELLGDMLLELKRPNEALLQYATELKANPNRFDSLYGAGRAAELAGEKDEATRYYAGLLANCRGSNSERPELIHATESLRAAVIPTAGHPVN